MNAYRSFAHFFIGLSSLLILVQPHYLRAAPVAQDQSVLETLAETLSKTDDATIQAALLRGMLAGLAGRRDVPAPKQWAELSEKLA
ncbi:MAG: hypothetical protein AAF483_17765, partial [Planctomycetota bacterium]